MICGCPHWRANDAPAWNTGGTFLPSLCCQVDRATFKLALAKFLETSLVQRQRRLREAGKEDEGDASPSHGSGGASFELGGGGSSRLGSRIGSRMDSAGSVTLGARRDSASYSAAVGFSTRAFLFFCFLTS